MPENQQIPILLYSRKSAALAISVSIRTIDYGLASNAFETRKVGRKTLITAASLRRYAARNHFGSVNGKEKEAAPKKKAAVNGSDEMAALKKKEPVNSSDEEAEL